MSVKYLYYTEDASTGGSLSAAFAVPGLDQILLMYGGERMCVHPDDADYRASASESYPTLKAAEGAYPEHTWIYLDAKAEQYIDELEHPADNVVYAVGHDLTGFDGIPLNGRRYKLRSLRHDHETHALICLISTAVDRWTRRHGCHSGE